jgi:hypothetical protein
MKTARRNGEKQMDLLTILLIVLIVLALGGWGYGSFYPGPGGVSPMVNVLGVVALVLLVALIVMLATGWRFGFEVAPPPP